MTMNTKSKTKSTTSHDVEVGQRIRARRMAQGMSQTELGNLLGVTFQQVQKYEKGVNRVGAGRLVRVGEALDVPVSFFFGATDAGSEDTRAILGFLDTSYSLRLLRAFSRIPPGGVQRAVVDLVESIAPAKGPGRRFSGSVTTNSLTFYRRRAYAGVEGDRCGVRSHSRWFACRRASRRPLRRSASSGASAAQAASPIGNTTYRLARRSAPI